MICHSMVKSLFIKEFFQSRKMNVKAEMSTTICGKTCRKSDNIHVRRQLGVIPGLQPSDSFINYKRSTI